MGIPYPQAYAQASKEETQEVSRYKPMGHVAPPLKTGDEVVLDSYPSSWAGWSEIPSVERRICDLRHKKLTVTGVNECRSCRETIDNIKCPGEISLNGEAYKCFGVTSCPDDKDFFLLELKETENLPDVNPWLMNF